MAIDQFLNVGALASLDAGIYLLLMAGVLRARRTSYLVNDPSEAFSFLERSIGKAFPDAPPGHTLREGIARTRSLGPKVDWDRVEEALVEYEGWRFGSREKKVRGNGEVVKLARSISRRRDKWTPH